jgi:hypothetical protein
MADRVPADDEQPEVPAQQPSHKAVKARQYREKRKAEQTPEMREDARKKNRCGLQRGPYVRCP